LALQSFAKLLPKLFILPYGASAVKLRVVADSTLGSRVVADSALEH
jgi:hypothetical protein